MSTYYQKLPTEDEVHPTISAPPPYGEAKITLQPSSIFPPTTSLPPAANFTSIVYKNRPVKGTYVIDNRIRVPSSVFVSDEIATGEEAVAPKARANARFGTTDDEIDIVLHLKGEGVVEVEVEMERTQSSVGKGNILKVAIASRDPLVVLKLSVKSKRCWTFVSLPPSFRGLVKGGSTSGDMIFSPALLPRTITYAVDQATPQEGRYFIGDWDSNEPQVGESDVLSVISECDDKRDVSIQEYGEEDLAEIHRQKAKKAEEKLGLIILGVCIPSTAFIVWALCH